MKSLIYNQKGEKSGEISLPEGVFNVPWNADLVHQVVVSYKSNERQPIAHAKGRSEVSGGGKKPWRQKGTGRARHGSSRSPIWVGGGVTHGPKKEKNFVKKINKKMKAKALYSVLSQKYRDNEVLFIEDFEIKSPKTKEAKDILSSLSKKVDGFGGLLTKRKNSAFLATFGKDNNVSKSFHNFGNLKVDDVKNLNPLDLLQFKYLIISNPKESIDFISGKMESSTKSKSKETVK